MTSQLETNPGQLFSDKLIEQLNLAYVCLDRDMKVVDVSDNIQELGFAKIPLGSKATDYLDFMVGFQFGGQLKLPAIISPGGNPVSVNLLSDDDSMVIVIGDASHLYEQRLSLQQTANENQLLLDKQFKLMAQLEEAGRLQSSFLSGVSHEFRTPLSSIIGYANLLRRDLDKVADLIPNADDYVKTIRRSGDHLLSLVENLLDHGKLDSGEIVINPKAINLLELFDDVFALMKPFSAQKKIDLNFFSDLNERDLVLVDASRLRQCLINIIGNAIKFTDTGSVSVTTALKDGQLQVSIADTGIGIDAQHLSQTLLPFWQAPDTGKAGTGLGLTITQRIVELLGGELVIDSEIGLGTTITFCLPAPLCDEQDHVLAGGMTTAKNNFRILLAEDDDDIAEFVTVLLEENGVNVERVANGQLAIELLQEAEFDLILMDLHMPVLNGYEAIRQIRSSGNNTPLVVMSATPIDTQEHHTQQLDCDAYLVKPVNVEDILRIAGELTQKS